MSSATAAVLTTPKVGGRRWGARTAEGAMCKRPAVVSAGGCAHPRRPLRTRPREHRQLPLSQAQALHIARPNGIRAQVPQAQQLVLSIMPPLANAGIRAECIRFGQLRGQGAWIEQETVMSMSMSVSMSVPSPCVHFLGSSDARQALEAAGRLRAL